jgi:hypothetical protein
VAQCPLLKRGPQPLAATRLRSFVGHVLPEAVDSNIDQNASMNMRSSAAEAAKTKATQRAISPCGTKAFNVASPSSQTSRGLRYHRARKQDREDVEHADVEVRRIHYKSYVDGPRLRRMLSSASAKWSGAVICPAFWCGAFDRWPRWSSLIGSLSRLRAALRFNFFASSRSAARQLAITSSSPSRTE